MSNQHNPSLEQHLPGELRFGGTRMALIDIKSGFWSIRRQMMAMVGERLTNSVLQQSGVNGGASYAKSIGIAKDDSEQENLFVNCIQALQTAGFGEFKIQQAYWPIGKVVVNVNSTIEAWMTLQHNELTEDSVCSYTAGVLVGFINVITGRKDVVCIERTCQAKGEEFCQFELLPVDKSENTPVVAFSQDPALGRNINLLEILFDRMPMGIAVLDREFRVQRFNPTWEEYSASYSSPSSIALSPGVNYFDHLPGTESTVIPLFERTLNGETVSENSVRLETKGIVSFWDIVLSPLTENNKVVGILIVSVDATKRVEAQQNLEQRIADRTNEIQMLLNIAAVANRSLNLDEMLNTTLDLIVTLLDVSRVGVMLLDETKGKLKPRMMKPSRSLSTEDLAQIIEACDSVVADQKPVFISTDPDHGLIEPGALLPLQMHDHTLGVLVIIGKIGNHFNSDQQNLFLSVADQLSVAVENARLYEKVEQSAVAMERNRLARDLHDAVTQTLFSASLISEVLPKLWEKNPDEGRRRLEEVRQLTRGALSEMRTLLLELRPTTLFDTDLDDLISHLVNAFIARTRLEVKFDKDVSVDPPSNVKEVFYRVAQEIFNNIIKHAEPSMVSVNLICHTENVSLTVQDDGCGFSPGDIPPDHLGLGIMKERANGIQALLTVNSQLLKGTTVQLSWNKANMENKND